MQGIEQYELNRHGNALEELVREHSSLVLKIAKKMKRKLPTYIEFDDLVQAGFIGLIEASKSFKADQGASFETFASIRVKGSMLDDLRKNSWNNREAMKNMKELGWAVHRVEQRLQRHASAEEIARELNVSMDEYDKLCQSINVCNMSSTNNLNEASAVLRDGDSPEDIVSEQDMKERIKGMLETLPERDKILLSLYYVEELTFKEIGEVLDLTEARICQLHATALARLAKKI